MVSNKPVSRHRLNQRKTVLLGGKSEGRRRQAMPPPDLADQSASMSWKDLQFNSNLNNLFPGRRELPMEPGAKRVKRRLAAILSADVAGYSRLMEADEVATLRALVAHRKVIDRLIAKYGGRRWSNHK